MTPEDVAELTPGQRLTIALPVTVTVVGFNGAHVWFETQSAPVHKLALLSENIEVIETLPDSRTFAPEAVNPHLLAAYKDQLLQGPKVSRFFEAETETEPETINPHLERMPLPPEKPT